MRAYLKKLSFKQWSVVLVISYFVLATIFWCISKNEITNYHSHTDILTGGTPLGEMAEGIVVEQDIMTKGDSITAVSLVCSTYLRSNTGMMIIEILKEKNVISQTLVDMTLVADGVENYIPLSAPVTDIKGKPLTLRVSVPGGVIGNSITCWMGNSINTGKANIPVKIGEWEKVRVNGAVLDGKLCFRLFTGEKQWFGMYYWYIIPSVGLLLSLYVLYVNFCKARGRKNKTVDFINTVSRYSFLIRQLVLRSFRTKYKRSVLGVMWSFLNPLLTMLVQYVVFSTVFKNDISNFVIYLLIGIVCFSFFNEACAIGLSSITGNSALITKVYVPKYIYPITVVLSSAINLVLSTIPLLLAMIVTSTPLRPAILLLPFAYICLIIFSMGMALMLSAVTVFFRDIQFLWGVIGTLWMYATPIFYPESIIPFNIMPFYKMNPMYHIIKFARIILIDGVSPAPMEYANCILISAIALAIGIVVFKKTQDQFVFNL